MRAGRLRDMGIGSYFKVSLAQARDAAHAARMVIRGGTDPIAVRHAEHRRLLAPERTFRMAAARVIDGLWAGFECKACGAVNGLVGGVRPSGDRRCAGPGGHHAACAEHPTADLVDEVRDGVAGAGPGLGGGGRGQGDGLARRREPGQPAASAQQGQTGRAPPVPATAANCCVPHKIEPA